MTFQESLDEAFPVASDANIIRGVSEGILLADKTLDNESFLRSLVGQDLRGHVRRAAILFRVHELAMAGDLPFSSTMSRMQRGNWHWIELKSNNFTSHIYRTDGPNLFPTDTPTRQDDRLSNQGDLFNGPSSIIPIKGYVAWLTFGALESGALSHLCWGMPNAKEDAWLARTNVIRRAREHSEQITPETPTIMSTLKFRDHVEEALKAKIDKQSDKPA